MNQNKSTLNPKASAAFANSLSAVAITYAGRVLQSRPERFDAVSIFETCEKPCGRGNIPRAALVKKSYAQFCKMIFEEQQFSRLDIAFARFLVERTTFDPIQKQAFENHPSNCIVWESPRKRNNN